MTWNLGLYSFKTIFLVSKCPNESVLINVILPHPVLIGDSFHELGDWIFNIDGKQVDLNGMVAVIVKCFDCNWTDGSESDWE